MCRPHLRKSTPTSLSLVATSPSTNGFQGLRVASLESRLASEMTRLITHHGGVPLVAPSMQERPLSENSEALQFGEALIAGSIEMLLLLTGAGFRTLLEVLQLRFALPTILDSLKHITLIARGPKPGKVLKEFGLTPQIVVPEPNTWKDILKTLDQHLPQGLQGIRLAVQEYGIRNDALLSGLAQRGAQLIPVPVYRWTLPDDLEPLKHVLQAISEGHVDVLLVTNAVQIDHAVRVWGEKNHVDHFRHALQQMVVASIGPVASEGLRHFQFPVDMEPTHAKMGILVKETSQAAQAILTGKRQTRQGENCSHD